MISCLARLWSDSMLDMKEKLMNLNKSIENQNEKIVDKVFEVDIDKIKANPFNFYDENYDLENLCESIKQFGLIEPIQITKDYVLVSGHRRYKACKQIGMNKVVAKFISGENDIEMKIVEANRQRKKTQEEEEREVYALKKYYEGLEKRGERPRGRIRQLIAKATGLSPATVQRRLVSNDTKTAAPKKEVNEVDKFQKQITSIIKKIDSEKLQFENPKIVDLIFELYDEINKDY